ncbi:hypothetical protein KUCAC02_000343, partial [Chaenocephalus aceratus]
ETDAECLSLNTRTFCPFVTSAVLTVSSRGRCRASRVQTGVCSCLRRKLFPRPSADSCFLRI